MATIPHVRLVAAGTLGLSKNEIWSCSMKLVVTSGGPNGAVIAPTQEMLATIALNGEAAWRNAIGGVIPGAYHGCDFSSWVTLEYGKASAVLASGLDDPTTNSVIQESAAGSSGGGIAGPTGQTTDYENPYAVALVVTLTGDKYRRGSAAYGRFYLPGINLHYSEDDNITQHMVDGTLNETVVTNYLNVAKLLVNQVNASNLQMPAGTNCYVSNIGTSATGAGARWQPVKHVSVDNRPDTVRRRQNAISGLGRQTTTIP